MDQNPGVGESGAFKSMKSTEEGSSSSVERIQGPSLVSRIKKEWLSFTSSLQEGLGHIKAILLGQIKRIKARNEKEATDAELQTAKMQVEATNAAEDKKKQLNM